MADQHFGLAWGESPIMTMHVARALVTYMCGDLFIGSRDPQHRLLLTIAMLGFSLFMAVQCQLFHWGEGDAEMLILMLPLEASNLVWLPDVSKIPAAYVQRAVISFTARTAITSCAHGLTSRLALHTMALTGAVIAVLSLVSLPSVCSLVPSPAGQQACAAWGSMWHLLVGFIAPVALSIVLRYSRRGRTHSA
eukprot:jgi/Botrbrau1/5530/Bobra.0023s0017.1